MIYGSVCSGIEAATAAWHPLGWEAAFFSEIEPFPRAVLSHRYPSVPLHGDFTTIQRGDYADINVLVGGTPCQSFSVAGLRKGLADPRGNLMLGFGALAERLQPKWLVWENVPGVLSSNGGRDFGSFLGMLAELRYGFAYRVLDAQFFGVAQRRRRVFVVGHAGDWRRAAAVLFERHSLSGHPAPSREARQRAPRGFSRSASERGWPAAVAPTLNAHFGSKQGLEDQHISGGGDCLCPTVSMCLTTNTRMDSESETLIPTNGGVFDVAHSLRGEGFDASEDGTGRGTPLVPVHAFDARQSNVIQYGDKTGPLDTDGHTMAVVFDTTQITSAANYSNPKPGDPCHPLAAGAHPPAVAFQSSQSGVRLGDTHATLDANNGPRRHNGMLHGMQVRRLTPVECERLQGFPDDFTAIPYRGKPASQCPDGPRYKALGNSMAVPVMAWLGRRIAAVEAIGATKTKLIAAGF